MSRILNIFASSNQTLNGADNIHIDDISQIVNYANQRIFVSMMNDVPEDKLRPITDELIKKLSVGGNIIIKILDMKRLCMDYTNHIISDQTMFKYCASVKNILSIKYIQDLIANNETIKIKKIENNEYYNIIVIERVGL
jgi:hypothetical protein